MSDYRPADDIHHKCECSVCDCAVFVNDLFTNGFCDGCNDGDHAPTKTAHRDTRGMDRFYAGAEPPFDVNDDFARTGSAGDY